MEASTNSDKLHPIYKGNYKIIVLSTGSGGT